LWCRGTNKPKEKEVRVDFIDGTGKVFPIERNENSYSDAIPIDLLCDNEIAPPNPIQQLIQTTIIRDEEITKFGVDLSERERFDFAKNAIAKMDFQLYLNKAQDIDKLIANKLNSFRLAYQQTRERISDLSARVSSVRTEGESAEKISTAQSTITDILGKGHQHLPDMINLARSHLVELRVRIERSNSILNELQQINDLLKQVDTDLNRKVITDLEEQIQNLQSKHSELHSQLKKENDQLTQLESRDPAIKSLEELRLHGEKLGLLDGRCPLCGSEVSEEEYVSHLQGIEDNVNAASASA
jgi:hypothetical protein